MTGRCGCGQAWTDKKKLCFSLNSCDLLQIVCAIIQQVHHPLHVVQVDNVHAKLVTLVTSVVVAYLATTNLDLIAMVSPL